MSPLRKKAIELRFENGKVPMFSTEGRRNKGQALECRKQQLQRVLADVYGINQAHSARLSCLRTDVRRVVRRLDRLGKAIIAEGVLDWHTEGRFGYTRMTAEVYQQQAADAMEYLIQTMTQNMDWYETLSQPLPKPQLGTLQPGKVTVKRGSIIVKPSQMELDMYAEVLRLSGGQRKLIPLAFDVCMLQYHAKAVIAINSQQARAIEEMYRMTSALGVWRVILACEDKFPQQLCTNLSCKVLHEVEWLLAEPSYFNDGEPSCVLHDTEASDGNHQQQQQQQPRMQQQLEGPASRPQQQVQHRQQHQAGGATEAHREQQLSAAVEDAARHSLKARGGTNTRPKAKGTGALRSACKGLLGVLASGLLAKGARAAASRLVSSRK